MRSEANELDFHLNCAINGFVGTQGTPALIFSPREFRSLVGLGSPWPTSGGTMGRLMRASLSLVPSYEILGLAKQISPFYPKLKALNSANPLSYHALFCAITLRHSPSHFERTHVLLYVARMYSIEIFCPSVRLRPYRRKVQ